MQLKLVDHIKLGDHITKADKPVNPMAKVVNTRLSNCQSTLNSSIIWLKQLKLVDYMAKAVKTHL